MTLYDLKQEIASGDVVNMNKVYDHIKKQALQGKNYCMFYLDELDDNQLYRLQGYGYDIYFQEDKIYVSGW